MNAYLTPEEYAALTGREAGDDTAALLDRASAQVDILTFQRIRAVGFEALTEMQQDLVKAATARQASFLTDYGDMADTPLASYGIGDVSMAWTGRRSCSSPASRRPRRCWRCCGRRTSAAES